jgi:hypothetical protein
MNRISFLIKAVVLFLVVSAPVSTWASSGYLFDAYGSVSIASGKDAPRRAVVNDTVTSGMTIRTGSDSHAVLKFEDGQVVSLQPNSTFLVREYIYNPQQVEKSNIVFSILKGGMRFVTGLIGQRNRNAFRLATPQATIGIRGTDFFAVLTNNGLYNQVLSGSISVTNAAGVSVFTTDNTALTASSTELPVSIPPAAVPAETFSQIAAIPVPPAVPGPIPLPTPEPVMPSAAVPAEGVILTGVESQATAGGAATGGAEAAMTTETAGTGISGTVIAIGLGVAAGAAALAATSSTTHH